MCVTADGAYAYTAGDDHTIRIWDLATGVFVQNIDEAQISRHGSRGMSNQEFVASLGEDKQIYFWDAQCRGRLGGEFAANGDVRTVMFNELGDSLILGTAAAGAGAVQYVRLRIDNEPSTVTIDKPILTEKWSAEK